MALGWQGRSLLSDDRAGRTKTRAPLVLTRLRACLLLSPPARGGGGEGAPPQSTVDLSLDPHPVLSLSLSSATSSSLSLPDTQPLWLEVPSAPDSLLSLAASQLASLSRASPPSPLLPAARPPPRAPPPAHPAAMFEQYDAEPAFDYYPPTPSSSASLFTRPSSTLTSKRSFEAGLPLDRAAASPIGSPAAWGQPHPHGSTSGGSFSFASFSGLAEQLFGGCGGGDGEDLASSFDGAVERKASASYPMAAELSAFSNSTIPTTSSSVDGYESYDSAFASSSAGSWGAASPSPYFAPIDLPAEDEPLSYVYDGPSSSVAFYDDNDDADAFGYPSSSSTSAYALALAPVPSVDDVPEWYDPSSSSTLSTKSSFDSFVSASSPLSGDRWDYYDFETDLANGSGSRAVDGSWGFAGPPQPRIAEGGGSDDDEVGSGFEQWVVPHQLVSIRSLPYVRPPSNLLQRAERSPWSPRPTAFAIRQATAVVVVALVIVDHHHAHGSSHSHRPRFRRRPRCDPGSPPQAGFRPGTRSQAFGRRLVLYRRLCLARRLDPCPVTDASADARSDPGGTQGASAASEGWSLVPQGVLPSARLCLGFKSAPVGRRARRSSASAASRKYRPPRALLRPPADRRR